MALTTVLTVHVKPERMGAYEAHVHRISDKAVTAKEPFEWAAYQVVAGRLGTIHFVSEVTSWTAYAQREPVELLIRRLMGETEGAKLLDQLAACILSERFVIGRDRPDLSYPVSPEVPHRAASLVSVMHVRPGGEDACEELIRKVAQAIPQVNDPRRFTAYESFIGDSRTYWIVTPLADVADLDTILSPRELLQKAFGAEGVLVHRTGFDAIDRLEREMNVLRPELSNAKWLGSVVGMRARPGAAAQAAH